MRSTPPRSHHGADVGVVNGLSSDVSEAGFDAKPTSAGPSSLNRRSFSRAAVGAYRLQRRTKAKLFSLLISGAFASFGRHSVLEPPLRLDGECSISLGDEVFLGSGSWLHALAPAPDRVSIRVGDGTSIVGNCVLSAARSITLGRRVLIARNAYIADHRHAFDDRRRAILDQGIAEVAPVTIRDGAWLGENVVVGPGVTIGVNAVIGANSVVLSDVPDFCVAVGAPARIVSRIHPVAGVA